MNRVGRGLILCLLLAPARESAAWHDTGHMIVAQIAYLRLTPAAKARVESLLVPVPNRRPLIHLCAGYYTPETCEKTYDPITIAVWMDDFRGDSLNESYAPWHYINFRPIFDGVPERPNVGAEPENVLSRINWAINALRHSSGARKDAETLGFLYHLVGDVHQPLHATTRYSPAQPDGDAGGNGFKLQMPPDTWVTNLHAFWDAAGGAFGLGAAPKRPLDPAAKARILTYAQELMQEHPASAATEWQELDPHAWVVESNTLARQVAYANVKEGETPSKSYAEQAQRLSRKRIAIAGYRLAAVLNALFVPVSPGAPAR